jgi:hypothetical protein
MENDTIFALILYDVCKDKIQMLTFDLVLILWNWKHFEFNLSVFVCVKIWPKALKRAHRVCYQDM